MSASQHLIPQEIEICELLGPKLVHNGTAWLIDGVKKCYMCNRLHNTGLGVHKGRKTEWIRFVMFVFVVPVENFCDAGGPL